MKIRPFQKNPCRGHACGRLSSPVSGVSGSEHSGLLGACPRSLHRPRRVFFLGKFLRRPNGRGFCGFELGGKPVACEVFLGPRGCCFRFVLLGSRASGGGSSAPPLGFLNLRWLRRPSSRGRTGQFLTRVLLQGGRWGPVPSANENVQSPGLLPQILVMCLRVQSENLF